MLEQIISIDIREGIIASSPKVLPDMELNEITAIVKLEEHDRKNPNHRLRLRIERVGEGGWYLIAGMSWRGKPEGTDNPDLILFGNLKLLHNHIIRVTVDTTKMMKYSVDLEIK